MSNTLHFCLAYTTLIALLGTLVWVVVGRMGRNRTNKSARGSDRA